MGIKALEDQNIWLKDMLKLQQNYVTDKLAELKDYTCVDADIGIRSNNTIILTGIYKRRAYVHFYDMGSEEFEETVERLRRMKDHCLIRNIDAPANFRGMFNI